MANKLVFEASVKDEGLSKYLAQWLDDVQKMGPASQKAFEYMNSNFKEIGSLFKEVSKNSGDLTKGMSKDVQDAFREVNKTLAVNLKDQLREVQDVYRQYTSNLINEAQKVSKELGTSPESSIENFNQRIKLAKLRGEIVRSGAITQTANDLVEGGGGGDGSGGGSGGGRGGGFWGNIGGGFGYSLIRQLINKHPYVAVAAAAGQMATGVARTTLDYELASPARAAELRRYQEIGIYSQAISGNVSPMLAYQDQKGPTQDWIQGRTTSTTAANQVIRVQEMFSSFLGAISGNLIGSYRGMEEINRRSIQRINDDYAKQIAITDKVAQMNLRYFNISAPMERNLGRESTQSFLQSMAAANIPQSFAAERAAPLLRYGITPTAANMSFITSTYGLNLGDAASNEWARMAGNMGGRTGAYEGMIRGAIGAAGLGGPGTMEARRLLSDILAQDTSNRVITSEQELWGAQGVTLRTEAAFRSANERLPQDQRINPIDMVTGAGNVSRMMRESMKTPGTLRNWQQTALLMQYGIKDPIEQSYWLSKDLNDPTIVKRMFENEEGRDTSKIDEFIGKQNALDLEYAKTVSDFGSFGGKKERAGMLLHTMGQDVRTVETAIKAGVSTEDVFGKVGKPIQGAEIEDFKQFGKTITTEAVSIKDGTAKWLSQLDTMTAGFSRGESELSRFNEMVSKATGILGDFAEKIRTVPVTEAIKTGDELRVLGERREESRIEQENFNRLTEAFNKSPEPPVYGPRRER
jgi:gas vesicle protein